MLSSILTNIYVLSFLIAMAGTFIVYLYLRVSKQTDEYTNSQYFKNFTILYITSLSALWCNNKFTTSNITMPVIVGGGNSGVSCGTNTPPNLNNHPSTVNMEKFNIGRPTF